MTLKTNSTTHNAIQHIRDINKRTAAHYRKIISAVTIFAAVLFLSGNAIAQEISSMSIDTNNIKYNVKTLGDSSSTPVVLLHGWMGTSHTWRKLAPLLAKNWHVIMPDMRGYGASDKPNEGYDAITLAADIAGVLEHFGHEKAHVVGHDMGALVALVYAGTYAENTLSLTYLDEPLVGYNLDEFTVYREETYGGYWHFGFNTAPGLAEILLSGKEQAFVDYLVPLMHSPNPDAVTAEDRTIYADSLRAENGITGNVGWYRASFDTARQIRAIGDTGGLSMPVMAWGGQYGVPVTFEQMSLVSDNVSGGVIEKAGHLLPEEVPDFLGTELDVFFKSNTN